MVLPDILHIMEDLSEEDIVKVLNRKRGYPDRRGFPWDKKEDQYLESLFNQGLTYFDIAREHKRSRTAIILRLNHLGLTNEKIEYPNFSKKGRFQLFI